MLLAELVLVTICFVCCRRLAGLFFLVNRLPFDRMVITSQHLQQARPDRQRRTRIQTGLE